MRGRKEREGRKREREGRERRERVRKETEGQENNRGGKRERERVAKKKDSFVDACGLFPQVRTIAAVLLRRVFLQMEHADLSEQIDSGVLQSCRAQLLVAVQSEPSPPIRRKICDAIAELARSSIGEFLTTVL